MLVSVIRDLQEHGVGIIYVSHRLHEIFQLASRATVLRDGELVGEVAVSEVTEEQIVGMMVGRKTTETRHITYTQDQCVLRVRNLSWGSKVRDVSFDLHRGEILGIAGLVGAGRTELMHLIAGLRPPTSGTIELNGQSVTFASPRQAIRAGIGMLPEDRKRSGIIPLLPVLSNTSLPVIQKYARFGWVANGRRRADVTRLAEQVNLRPRNIDRPIRYFSGGNQQKAILSRWLIAISEILVFDEPTRGIDVGAKGRNLSPDRMRWRQQGKAILDDLVGAAGSAAALRPRTGHEHGETRGGNLQRAETTPKNRS